MPPKIGPRDLSTIFHEVQMWSANSELPKLASVIRIGPGHLGKHKEGKDYADVIEGGALVSDEVLLRREKGISCHDVCNLQLTSGTTGNPKAAQLTHRSVILDSDMVV